jgi:hypothetical protein
MRKSLPSRDPRVLAISRLVSGELSAPELPVSDVLTLTSCNRLVKQPNDVIAREVEVTHRLRRRIVVTRNDRVAIETDEVFMLRAHRRSGPKCGGFVGGHGGPKPRYRVIARQPYQPTTRELRRPG